MYKCTCNVRTYVHVTYSAAIYMWYIAQTDNNSRYVWANTAYFSTKFLATCTLLNSDMEANDTKNYCKSSTLGLEKIMPALQAKNSPLSQVHHRYNSNIARSNSHCKTLLLWLHCSEQTYELHNAPLHAASLSLVCNK